MIKQSASIKILCIVTVITGLFYQCDKTPKPYQKTKIETVYVEQSIKPVIEEIYQTYLLKHAADQIRLVYASEDVCKKALSMDSTLLLIGVQPHAKSESEAIKNNIGLRYLSDVLAYEGIAVISNIQTPIQRINRQILIDIFQKNAYQDHQLVIDGKTATGIYHFLQDSLVPNKSLSSMFNGLSGADSVIDYISKTPKSIGFISTMQLHLVKEKVVIASVLNSKNNQYYTPEGTTIYSGFYDLVRPIGYIYAANYHTKSMAFLNYLIYEKGQLLFKRYGMIPNLMNLNIRNISIEN